LSPRGGVAEHRRAMRRFPALLAALLLLFASAAQAQERWPQKPVRVVVAFAAGGAIDVVTRIVTEHMSKTLGQPLVVDNRPGAGSVIAAEAVAKAAPDGYTFLVNGAAQSVIPTLYPTASVDIVKDFTPVSMLGRVPFVMTINPKVLPGVEDYRGFVAYLKAHPGEVNFGSSGPGSAAHLSSELFKRQAGVDFVHVPYRGTPASTNGLLAGEVGFMIDAQNLLSPHIKQGTLKGLAMTSLRHTKMLPDLPTLDELGLKGFEASSWQGMYGPANTPRQIVDKLAEAVAAALADSAVQARLLQVGVEIPTDLGPENLAKYLASESKKWGTVIREAGVTAN
jgi:tripartite-type tricarboxylate transporter receptor subunit TctC